MPGQLIRRYGGAAVPYGTKRMRLAYGVGRYAYSNRHKIYHAGKTIYRAYRSYKSRTRQVGFKVGQSSSKRHVINDAAGTDVGTVSLQFDDLTLIPASNDNAINERQRDIVNLRGFKICMEISRQANVGGGSVGTQSRPLYVNIAVISPRQRNTADATNLTSEFFRSDGTGRSVDFNAATLSDMERHCRPINKDKWIILKHWRFMLSAFDQLEFLENKRSGYTLFQKYVPLKRQVRYDSSGNVDAGQVYFVYWFGQFNTGPTATTEGGVARVQKRLITYFKEPKN